MFGSGMQPLIYIFIYMIISTSLRLIIHIHLFFLFFLFSFLLLSRLSLLSLLSLLSPLSSLSQILGASGSFIGDFAILEGQKEYTEKIRNIIGQVIACPWMPSLMYVRGEEGSKGERRG